MNNLINNNNFNQLSKLTYLPENLHFILIGILLGDGSIYRYSTTSNSRFEMSFGTKYKKFAESIGILFKDYMNTPVKDINLKIKDKIYVNYRLKTKSLPIFNQYHDMFYKLNTAAAQVKYIKIIPHNI